MAPTPAGDQSQASQSPESSSQANQSQGPKKKVVSHGGTDEPVTQISPSMSEEQVAKTRAATASLINETDDNLQKLSSRQLSSDERETVDQIRKFVEQSKAADQQGDLPRAATLANKAKLLSEALVKE